MDQQTSRSVGQLPRSRALVFAAALIGLGAGLGSLVGCHAVQQAAARDPQRCERDPKCADTRHGKPNDCSTQCVDDRACMERCQQINFSR